MKDDLARRSLALKPGVYLTAGGGQGILLDIVDDQYWAIDAEAGDIWRLLASGATARGVAVELAAKLHRDVEATQIDIDEQLSAWASAGLVVPFEHQSTVPASREISSRAAEQFVPAGVSSVVVWASCLYSVLRASMWVRRGWRIKGLNVLLSELQKRRGPSSIPFDNCVSATVRTLQFTRRAFRQGKKDCLERSLQLAGALRLNGVDATVSIGIRQLPFEAHAWVESDGQVVGDSLDRTATFKVLARF